MALHQEIETLERRVGKDGTSPLFAQLASYYLEQNRAQDALRLCDAGLANFPFYTTGHLIKGKTLVELKMYAEARREFEFVADFLPANHIVHELLQNLPSEENILTAPSPDIPAVSPMIEPQRPSVQEPSVNPAPMIDMPTVIIDQPHEDFEYMPPAAQAIPAFTPPEQKPSSTNIFDSIPPSLLDTTTATPSDQNPFADFSFTPSSSPAVAVEPQNFTSESFGNFDFPFSQKDEPASVPVPEETFQQFSERKVTELSGENSVSLDEYFTQSEHAIPLEKPPVHEKIFDNTVPSPPTPVQSADIEELTTKLQGAGKITPVINLAQKEITPASSEETPSSVGFVTPTLAEIYAKQGWFDDAIKAYTTLAQNKPADRERYERRIAELEELKKQAGPQ